MKLRISHTKGKHYAKLPQVIAVTALAYLSTDITLHFDEKSKYTLDRGDQYDWNKVIGRGGTAIKSGLRKNEDLVVWRYIAETNEFHVANDYRRRNYQMYLPKEWEVIKDSGSVRVSRKNIERWILGLGGYFGGNRTAPCDLIYTIKFHFFS